VGHPDHRRGQPLAGPETGLTSPKPVPATRKGNPQGQWNPAHPARQPGHQAQPATANGCQAPTSGPSTKITKDRG
jgi:hypothetical protein